MGRFDIFQFIESVTLKWLIKICAIISMLILDTGKIGWYVLARIGFVQIESQCSKCSFPSCCVRFLDLLHSEKLL